MFRFFFALFILFSSFVHAQITVSINSGDPVFPFPQFQPYANSTDTLGNLGTRNSQGVPHAEMEQTIRDAYQIMMNRAIKPGGGVGGIDYIQYQSNPQCSEGDGYGLLGAAAMADKQTFDGMWLYIHDFTMNKVKRYSDCQDASPGYQYSQLPGWTGAGANSAADGDFDIAFALLTAYKQWGEFMGIDDACGNPISYKQAAIDFLTALSDTVVYGASGSLLSGDIGIDGYFKGGDSWAELSGWSANTAQTGFSRSVEQPGPSQQYFDYTAPSYFHQFADFLAGEDSVAYAWNIHQFRRAEASSDWLIGKMFEADPRNLPISGNVSLSGTTPSFTFTGNMGEDFRLAWRTILNRMWHGNPSYTWNPESHQVIQNQPNIYLQDMANRFALFMWDARKPPWNNPCMESVGTDPFSHWGPMTLLTDISMTGTGGSADGFYFLNWVPAVGSPSAIVSQDFNLISELYRYIEIEWDVTEPGDGYLTSVPYYYHGWYRVLGLLILSGNYHAPSNMVPAANTKVYLDIDKSFAFEKDTLAYTIDYRNYGSVDAEAVVIVDTLHPDFSFVSATGGGAYDNVAHTVTWNIGTLQGFRTATGVEPTKGQVQLKVVIARATQKQYRNSVHISCNNGSGWMSNDYPNNITAVMERNHLDIARRALILEHSASKDLVKPGETVEFTIIFLNSSEAGWINGGRPGVSFSFSQGTEGAVATMNTMRARLYHDAAEAYIDFGNYRISYFLYDEKNQCIAGEPGCDNGWAFMQTITEGIAAADVKLVHEQIIPGQDERGKWNQRLIVQFSDPEDPNREEKLTTIDRHLSGYRGMRGRIHKGGTEPLRLVWFFNSSDWQEVNWGEAWSWDGGIADNDGGDYFPVTNDWSDPDRPDVPNSTWNRKACREATKTVDNILVEEWDGYTWRRVAGNGPMPGREANNVEIRDTLPEGFTFQAFTGEDPMGVTPKVNGRIVTWSVPKMQIMEGGTIKFTARADGSCPGAPDLQVTNRAWISADKESPFADSSIIAISCDTVIKPPPPDHIDIVLDISDIDSLRDEDFVRIEMDEGTMTAVVYAVVRDRNGKFVRRVENAVWTSRDVAVATVTSPNVYQGNIVKVDGGSTVIVVSEPGNPSITPDSLAITAVATPPWPAIASAVMRDDNGDITPDLLNLALNDTFHVNQRLDSVAIEYRGNRYSFVAAALTLQQTSMSIPFVSLSGTDPEPSGQVTMFMTVDGTVKQHTKEFTDGVGPALVSASLVKDAAGANDTLRLAFTEEVHMPTLKGANLQLIRVSTGDTVLLTVLDYIGPEIYEETRAVVTSGSGVRPGEGDLLRLLPGAAGGTLEDRKKNPPHRLNRPVVITAGPAQLTGGWYVDENADGVVEAVYLQFDKPVPVDSMTVSIRWGAEPLDNLTSDNFTVGADRSLVRVSLPESYMAENGIKTSGAMFTRVVYTGYVGEERNGEMIDQAAPVITKAEVRISTPESPEDTAVEIMAVTFSEKVRIEQAPNYFNMLRDGTIPYTLALQLDSLNDTVAFFTITGVNGVEYPEAGDSIRINPVSAVGDSLVWQNNPENRREILSIDRGKVDWTVIVSPNPMNPDLLPFDTAGVQIRIVNKVNRDIPIPIRNAVISIYDPMGHPVVTSASFRKTDSGIVFMWDGCNMRRRKVGNGTYIGAVTVEDEFAEGFKKVKIGVLRRKEGILP